MTDYYVKYHHNVSRDYRLERIYKNLPIITDIPKIVGNEYRISTKGNFLNTLDENLPMVFPVKTPDECSFESVVNFNIEKFGMPPIAITGGYGSGKSNLLKLVQSFYLAKGFKIFSFNDHRIEGRHLAAHGFVNKDSYYQPFQVKILIKKDVPYYFDERNLVEDFDNVHLLLFEDINDIIREITPYCYTIVYTANLDHAERLKLWIRILSKLSRVANKRNPIVYADDEFSSLIQEMPDKSTYKLTQIASYMALGLRKDYIGLFTCFHMLQEVFYRVSQKYGFEFIKKPVNRNFMSAAHNDAKGFKVNEVNICRGGYWRHHTIGYHTELPDVYRILPENSIDETEIDLSLATREREKYNVETKLKALIYLINTNTPYKEVAKHLGVKEGTLKSWKANFKQLDQQVSESLKKQS